MDEARDDGVELDAAEAKGGDAEDARGEQARVVGVAQEDDGERARSRLHGVEQRAVRRVEVRVEQEQHRGVR